MKTFQIREDAEKVEVVKVQKNWPLSKLYEAMKFNIEYSIFEIAYCENKLIQIYQEIPWNETKVHYSLNKRTLLKDFLNRK